MKLAIAVCCCALHICCSVLQCVAVCCSVLQCVAVCCSVLALGPALAGILESLEVKLEAVSVCCSVLLCIAAHEGDQTSNI